MKLSKFQFATSILLIVSIICVVAYVSAEQNYYSRMELPVDVDYPELEKMFGDLDPFYRTKKGQPFFIAGIVLFISWGIIICQPNLWKRKAIVALILLSLLSLTVFPIRTVQAHEWIAINVLCAGDEEFDLSYADYIEDAIQMACTFTSLAVTDSFGTTFNIHFNVIGWISWESTDYYSQLDPRYMAAEVLIQTGFLEGLEYNGKTVHMLFACTGQDIMDKEAVSYPDANLVMIEELSACNYGVIRHEFSHQFDCEECTGICVMNRGCLFHIPPLLNWCSNCEDWIEAHKFKWPDAAEHSHSFITLGGGGSWYYEIP